MSKTFTSKNVHDEKAKTSFDFTDGGTLGLKGKKLTETVKFGRNVQVIIDETKLALLTNAELRKYDLL